MTMWMQMGMAHTVQEVLWGHCNPQVSVNAVYREAQPVSSVVCLNERCQQAAYLVCFVFSSFCFP